MKNLMSIFRRPYYAFAFFGIFIFQFQKIEAQVCSNPTTIIYGISSDGSLVPINDTTAVVSSAINPYFGNTSNANAIGYNPVNGKFYYFQNRAAGTQVFVSFDPSTTAYAILASSPITADVLRGSVTQDGTGFYCMDANLNLCYYNIAANTWTLICSNYTDQFSNQINSSTNTEQSGDMAFDGLGNLWIVNSSSNNWALYRITAPVPITYQANINVTQLVPPTTATPSGSLFAGIAFSSTGGIYMSTSDDLYLLSPGYTLSHIGAFSTSGVGDDLTSCNFPFSTLPVFWQNFNASRQNNQSVLISWQVLQQGYNKGFYIERSNDGVNWNELNFIQTNGGTGSSEQYSYFDNDPLNGESYYRICEIDMDGAKNYSEIKSVNGESASNLISIWPNPARDILNIQNDRISNYQTSEIYNQRGEKVAESKLQTGANSINISFLPFGVYIIHLKSAGYSDYNYKLIKD